MGGRDQGECEGATQHDRASPTSPRSHSLWSVESTTQCCMSAYKNYRDLLPALRTRERAPIVSRPGPTSAVLACKPHSTSLARLSHTMSAARGPAARAAVSACSNAARATPRRALHSAAAPSPSSSSSSASPSLPPQASSSKQRAQDEAYDAMLKKVQQRRAERHTGASPSSLSPLPSPRSRRFFPVRASTAESSPKQCTDRERVSYCAADVFTKLGSTQNRDTTFQPHHSLHRPPAPPAVTTSHLVAAGAHLGHSPANTHRAALPLVYGTRTGVSYIDLRQTLPALRRAAQVVKGVVERDGRVLFVGSLKGAERAVWDNAKRLGDNGFGVTKWLPGTISNAREVFGWCEIPGTGTGAPGEREQRATPLAFKPDLLVLLSPTLNRHALREATANEIPTIGIIDTDLDPRSVTYAIPANDDSPRAVELIAGVLGMAGKDGLRAKQDRCVSRFPCVRSFGSLPLPRCTAPLTQCARALSLSLSQAPAGSGRRGTAGALRAHARLPRVLDTRKSVRPLLLSPHARTHARWLGIGPREPRARGTERRDQPHPHAQTCCTSPHRSPTRAHNIQTKERKRPHRLPSGARSAPVPCPPPPPHSTRSSSPRLPTPLLLPLPIPSPPSRCS